MWALRSRRPLTWNFPDHFKPPFTYGSGKQLTSIRRKEIRRKREMVATKSVKKRKRIRTDHIKVSDSQISKTFAQHLVDIKSSKDESGRLRFSVPRTGTLRPSYRKDLLEGRKPMQVNPLLRRIRTFRKMQAAERRRRKM